MNRVFWKRASLALPLALLGVSLASPLRAQDRGRSVQTFTNRGTGIQGAIRENAVQKELALTDDQLAKLRKIAEEVPYWDKAREALQDLRAAETDEQRAAIREKLRLALETLSFDTEAKFQQVLSEPQFERAMQITLQREGGRALLRSDVVRDLKITAEQIDQLKGAANDFDATRMQQQGFANGIGDREKLREDFEARMLGILTNEQKTQWTAKLGKLFPTETGPTLRGQTLPPGLLSSNGGRTGSFSASQASAPRAADGGTSPPSSYGMIEGDSIEGAIQFVVVTEALAARGGARPINRDQLRLLTNLERRLRSDSRPEELRQKLFQAKTLEECAAIRQESYVVLERWNAEVEQEVRTILGDAAFAKLRPALLRRQGLWGMTRPDVAAELKLTAAQSEQLQAILTDYRAAAAAASVDATRQDLARLAAPFAEKMRKVLTPDQLANPSVPLDRVGE